MLPSLQVINTKQTRLAMATDVKNFRMGWRDWRSWHMIQDVDLMIHYVKEQDPMWPSWDRPFPPPHPPYHHVLYLPLVCRKTVVFQASPETQKSGSRIND